MSIHSASLLHTRTRLQAGNAASDQCYAERNVISFECALKGWPKEDGYYISQLKFGLVENMCPGNKNEINLMKCLQKSGEANWWKDFAGCTSAEQCIDQAKNKHEALMKNL